jgi:hypothetical protein
MSDFSKLFHSKPVYWGEGFLYCVQNEAKADVLKECMKDIGPGKECLGFFEGWNTAHLIMEAHNARLNQS